MQFNEVSFGGALPIDSYGPGFFRIGGKVMEGACLILPTGACAWDGPDAPAPLIEAASEIDLVVLGLGAEVGPLPFELLTELQEAGIGVEPMITPTACRTYNVLLAEGRRVAAALLPV